LIKKVSCNGKTLYTRLMNQMFTDAGKISAIFYLTKFFLRCFEERNLFI